MNMKKIRKRAAKAGVKAGKLKKTDLIHAIQIHEGNSPCFLTGIIGDGNNRGRTPLNSRPPLGTSAMPPPTFGDLRPCFPLTTSETALSERMIKFLLTQI